MSRAAFGIFLRIIFASGVISASLLSNKILCSHDLVYESIYDLPIMMKLQSSKNTHISIILRTDDGRTLSAKPLYIFQ